MDTPGLPAWHVVGSAIREETELPEHGTTLRTVHVVPYIIDSGPARGHHGVVRVEPRDFHPAGVEEAINAAVAKVHGVGSLSSAGA